MSILALLQSCRAGQVRFAAHRRYGDDPTLSVQDLQQLGFDAEFCTPAHLESLYSVPAAQAKSLLMHFLNQDLAYSVSRADPDLVQAAVNEFFDFFDPAQTRFYTNWNDSAWQPMAEATFDAGLIACGSNVLACLWVEDED
jgi:hypothetical protein